MKYLSYILIVIIAIFTTMSCEKILDVQPTQSLSTDLAFQNKNDVLRALTGCYDALQQGGLYSLNMVVIPDLVADNLDHTGTRQEYGQIDNNSILAENYLIEGVWNDSYDALNRINSLLDKLPEITDMTASEKDNVKGQLYFLRALLHFNLVNYFGAVPIKTTPTYGVDESLDVGRDNIETVFAQIITDLNNALGKIDGQEHIFASDGAVKALLARVYLFSEKWEQAKNFANNVIASATYELDPDYNNLFSGGNSNEIIFQIEFNTQDQNTLAYYFFPTSEEGRNEFTPSKSMDDAYETSDTVRKNASLADQGHVHKYRDITTGTDNVNILRLAEMYLIRAEAEAKLNGDLQAIKEDINAIRNRAGLENTTAVSYGELMMAIEQERRVEFAFEGYRWFDLIRTGRAMDLLDNITSTNQLLFPIPLSEITANTNPGMYQNPGY
ncbi:MAG: RagB/SusD family nutrient uptake outer membrane protein [Bacteroidales bacterium]